MHTFDLAVTNKKGVTFKQANSVGKLYFKVLNDLRKDEILNGKIEKIGRNLMTKGYHTAIGIISTPDKYLSEEYELSADQIEMVYKYINENFDKNGERKK